MDKERKKRLQTVRLIITEILMVAAVVVTVIVLTFVAMGYNVDKNGELNQSGLAQIKSMPSGATVTIDDETLLLHTNTSRMLDAGSHHVKLEKDGYLSWEKDITITSGVLLKLDYPRLFLKERSPETVREFKNDFELFSISKDRNQILYAIYNDPVNSSQNLNLKDSLTKRPLFILLNIRGDDVTETTLDFSEILKYREIINISWSNSNDYILLETKNHDKTEWLILNLRDPASSYNLTYDYGLNFSSMEFMGPNNERLIAIENGNLRIISVSEHSMSEALAKNVKSFNYNDSNLAYLTNDNALYLLAEDSSNILIKKFPAESTIKFLISSYLDRKYVAFFENNRFYVYSSNTFPTKDAGLDTFDIALESDIDFAPDNFYIWSENEFFVATKDNKIALFDAELDRLSRYDVEGNFHYFLDDYLIGAIKDDKLIVYDFDGTNRHELASATGLSTIAKNSKYLYYQNGRTITREKTLN